MNFFLRVEGMNLGNFVMDTSDLATIRGGSLLLLEAMDRVEEEIFKILQKVNDKALQKKSELDIQFNNELNEVKHDSTLSKAQKKKKKKEIREKRKLLKSVGDVTCVTKGASWGLFTLDNIDTAAALEIRGSIEQSFNSDPLYQHATFTVDLYQKNEKDNYQAARDKVQTLNRWQQLQAPSVAIAGEGDEVCAVDRLRPIAGAGNLNWKGGKVSASASVKARRDYGVQEKKTSEFYKKRGLVEEDSQLKFTHDLEELSQNPPEYAADLKGKIAFIYLDGNSFGKIQKKSQSTDQQRAFDKQTREGREKVLQTIISRIKDRDDWLAEGKVRLETLLWGGDEIIWVVPAWQGWLMLDCFYKLAKKNIRLKKIYNGQAGYTELYHGASIVFCHHNAPIQRIDSLARSLADNFAKKEEYKKADKIAYQVLESFDHVSANLVSFRQGMIRGLETDIDNLLINAEDMESVHAVIRKLKKGNFPKRKLYQIIQAYRAKDNGQVDKLYKKLIGTNKRHIPPTRQQEIYQEELERLENVFNGSKVYWLHLLELWDFVGLDQPKLSGEEV